MLPTVGPGGHASVASAGLVVQAEEPCSKSLPEADADAASETPPWLPLLQAPVIRYSLTTLLSPGRNSSQFL